MESSITLVVKYSKGLSKVIKKYKDLKSINHLIKSMSDHFIKDLNMDMVFLKITNISFGVSSPKIFLKFRFNKQKIKNNNKLKNRHIN